MTRGRAKDLSDEDRVLWSLVARTTRPLRGTRVVEVPALVTVTMEEAMAALPPEPGRAIAVARKTPTVAAELDKPTRTKLANGRLPIEGRVDLHGMTQSEAYSLLLSFLSRAHAGGVRYVLVITGKGTSSGGEGVLRRAVPGWLATPPFRAFVSSHDHAARNHGGEGALYIRLRRRAVSA